MHGRTVKLSTAPKTQHWNIETDAQIHGWRYQPVFIFYHAGTKAIHLNAIAAAAKAGAVPHLGPCGTILRKAAARLTGYRATIEIEIQIGWIKTLARQRDCFFCSAGTVVRNATTGNTRHGGRKFYVNIFANGGFKHGDAGSGSKRNIVGRNAERRCCLQVYITRKASTTHSVLLRHTGSTDVGEW